MNAKRIRGWLLCQPRPALIRLQCADGQVHEIELAASSTLASAAQSIEALQPEVLEALDAKGKLLRALRPGDEDEASSSSSSSTSSPATRSSSDPETQRFELVARLVAEAYRHSNEVAFQRMVDLFDAVNRRSESTERAREMMYRQQVKALEDQIRALGEQPQESGDLLSQMLGSFMGGMGAPPAPAPAPPSNGAAHPKAKA